LQQNTEIVNRLLVTSKISGPVRMSKKSGFRLACRRAGEALFPPHTRRRQLAKNLSSRLLRTCRYLAGGRSVLPGKSCASDYAAWLSQNELSAADCDWMRRVGGCFSRRPRIAICLLAEDGQEPLVRQSVDAVRRQAWPEWELYIAVRDPQLFGDLSGLEGVKLTAFRDQTALNNALFESRSGYVGFIEPGGLLRPHALFEAAQKLNLESSLDIIYGDCDTGAFGGERTAPFFKPDWSPELLLGMNYIGDFFLISKSRFKAAGGLTDAGAYDLLLRATDAAAAVGHIPSVIYSKPSRREAAAASRENKAALEAALKRRGIKAEVVPLKAAGTHRIKYEISGAPKVSVIIPTAFKTPELLRDCLSSLVKITRYSNYEILIADNSREKLPEQFVRSLAPARIPLRILKYDGVFNFSRMNNRAAGTAAGEYLLFLNDDTRVISPGWLEALLEHAQRPGNGAAGARLLYPDGTVQHAGMFLVDHGGWARHCLRHAARDCEEHFSFLSIARECSAVTGACMMVPRSVFEELGGFEERLAVQCNDTDFCLRARRRGYNVVWTPFAVLEHREFGTRAAEDKPEDIAFFLDRWRGIIERGDPFYNPNLTLHNDDCSLNSQPVQIRHHEPRLSGFRGARKPCAFGEIKKILVIKLDHLGDFILSLPALRMLRDRFPAAHITLLVGPWAKPLAQKTAPADEILTLNLFAENSSVPARTLSEEEKEALSRRLGALRFDLALDLRRHPESREILKLSGARHTAGYAGNNYAQEDDWMSIRLQLSPDVEDISRQQSKTHITAQLCALVNEVAGDGDAAIAQPAPLPPDDSIRKRLLARLRCLSGGRIVIGVHPGAGNPARQWPPAHFARLCDMLAGRHNAAIALFGGKEDVLKAEAVASLMKNSDSVFSLAGELSLEEFRAAAGLCRLFIGNVSGPAHIAAAQGAPTLVVWAGPVLPHEWHPLGLRTLSVRLKLDCSPCYLSAPEQCPHDMKCLKFLWPAKVLEAAERLLAMTGGNPDGATATEISQRNVPPAAVESHCFVAQSALKLRAGKVADWAAGLARCLSGAAGKIRALRPPVFPGGLPEAKGHFDLLDYKDGRLTVSGWLFLPDRDFDKVAVFANEKYICTAGLSGRDDVARAFPAIAHVGHSGFSVSQKIMAESPIHVRLAGIINGKPAAKLEKLWHGADPAAGCASETAHCRGRLAKYCAGCGVDLGCGGDPIVPSAIKVDLPAPYTRAGGHPPHLRGDATHLHWFADDSLDYVYSSHLLEDFQDMHKVLAEWLRVIKPGGWLVLFCPDEQAYRGHCRATGEPGNPSHKIAGFSLAYVKSILAGLGGTEIVHETPLIDTCSFELVARKSA